LDRRRVSLVIPAAGQGTRFGGVVAKQLLPLKGRAVLLRSLDAFAGQVDEAIIAVSAQLRPEVEALLAGTTLPFPVRLAAGGATRQDSVSAGVHASDPASELVLVHDAVRPLVPPACIAACIAALSDHVAALVAVPCTATVKRADAGGRVLATVPRDDLWLAQTPQGFRRAEGLAAFARAAAGGWSCSDDAQVLERAGYDVALVPGDARNLKLTTPDDWAVAEALIGE
jgi:2-C-methyl-D-erythritol 4-phosphate cytidylyltransferase